MTAGDWATVADLATALGTLVLAFATFAAIRSSNASARIAERSLLIGLRPVLSITRRDDPMQKVNYGDRKWVRIPPASAAADIGGGDGSLGQPDNAVYLALGLRNVGSGMAVLHGWRFYPEWYRSRDHASLEEFRPQTRDLYVAPADIGFWQAAFRDPADPQYDAARKAIADNQPWTVELLYGDTEGGQRTITRFQAFPRESAEGDPDSRTTWLCSMSRYWNIDHPDPG
jgi:hypothetical protein